MPRIGSVEGLTFHVYFEDHLPVHFHVRTAGRVARIAIDPVRVLDSTLTASEERAALAWGEANAELVRARFAECNP